jgi:hypothetical protein
MFSPHLLVVPTGSSVTFPNLDPFFHNVFSLFNGKRFDLGLYAGHSQRTVRFDREGVSYIFCNIHPDMGAIVVSLNTQYYAITLANGEVSIRGVPTGNYRLHIWAENVNLEGLNALSRDINVTAQNNQIGIIHLIANEGLSKDHKNKFGESYPHLQSDPY